MKTSRAPFSETSELDHASSASDGKTNLPSPYLQKSGKPQLRWPFQCPHRTLSWAIHGGGFQRHTELVWLQVKNSDLSLGVCPKELLLSELRRGQQDEHSTLVFLTSAYLDFYQEVRVEEAGIEVVAIATTGLGNALRAGDPASYSGGSRTINLACLTNCRLDDNALLEAMSIMTEAKTAAIMEAGVASIISGRMATGTGTDCQAIVCPEEGVAFEYSGKHTLIGSLIGRACLEAIRLGVAVWNESSDQRLAMKRASPAIENPYPKSDASLFQNAHEVELHE